MTRDEAVIISIKIQTVSNKDATVQTLPFLTDRTHFHGPPPRLCGLDCGLEHMPNKKFAGEKPFCVCVLDLTLFHRLLDRQEGSCKQSAVQVLQAGSGRHATAVV